MLTKYSIFPCGSSIEVGYVYAESKTKARYKAIDMNFAFPVTVSKSIVY